MQSALSRIVVIFAFSFGAFLVAASTFSQYDPPEEGQIGDCYDGKDYGLPAQCTENAEACGGSGVCAVLEAPYACPNSACAGEGCEHFRKIETDSVGYCSYMPMGTEQCTRCAWFCCARGDFYETAANCEDQANKRCDGVIWVDGACNFP